jgi:hypothetical protein
LFGSSLLVLLLSASDLGAVQATAPTDIITARTSAKILVSFMEYVLSSFCITDLESRA